LEEIWQETKFGCGMLPQVPSSQMQGTSAAHCAASLPSNRRRKPD
jgi:hypothetical protein